MMGVLRRIFGRPDCRAAEASKLAQEFEASATRAVISTRNMKLRRNDIERNLNAIFVDMRAEVGGQHR